MKTDRLILFGRYPVPGRTKTRLIPFLGPAGCAELQRRLTEKIHGEAKAATFRGGLGLEIHFEGGTQAQMRRWLGPDALYSIQCGQDLGRRMENAFRKAFREGCGRVVLFGSDVPGLSASILLQAMERLKDRDVVLGPSTDGGYWLVGLKKSADLFGGIEWASDKVLSQTRAKADRLGLSTALIDPLTDVDTREDIHRLLPEWRNPGPYLSVVITALDEARHIGEAVRSALCADAEVLVVDGGSRDGTQEAALRAGARLVESPRGRGVQQNNGAGAARGGVLLFLHADTRLPENYETHVFETLMGRGVVLGAFRLRTDLKEAQARVIEAMVNFRARHLRLPYGDQALFVRKQVFEKAGGFTDVPIGEDLFLVKRMGRRGRIALADAAVTTSGRRWARVGLLRTTWTNQVMLAGFAMGISVSTLAAIYGRQGLRKQREDQQKKPI